ncbi:MAG TPA: hypothetical protein VFK39_01355 [Gemmatimonadaceae bacterium]|nr:hypothetical protein [Gemmatimonadaceae bacterium]
MSELSLERVRRGGERLMEELSREYYRAQAGLQSSAELAPIYARYSDVLSDDSLQMMRELFRGASSGSQELHSARVLLDWQAEGLVSRTLAPLDEREIAWEGSAMVNVADGRRIPFQRIAIEIANTTDRGERLSLEAARAKLVAAELAPLRRERFQRERDLTEGLDIAPNYNATFNALSGIELAGLVDQCQTFLRDTREMWEDVFRARVRQQLGIDPRDATRADALALMRAPQFDPYFPSSDMEREIRRQTEEMGVDAHADGRVIFDTAEREGKRSRAFCAPVRVPDEVYLVLRPHGGQADYRTFLHELGHALHFGYTRSDLAFEFRWLGDNSITEGYAMLFDHLMHDSGWLLRYTGLGRSRLPEFLRAVGFEELHFLRRYAAKLIYEYQLYSGEVPWDSLPDLYVATLSDATSFSYNTADAFVDVDPRYYAARYLRAWQLQALIAHTLVERFDEDWFRNPRSGPWIVEHLFAEGQRELAQELAERVAGEPLSFAPLLRATEALLV